MPTSLSSHRRAFSLLSLLAAAGGASLAASCTLDLQGQGTGGGSTSTTSGMGGSTMVCTPLTEKKPCYTGALGTQDKGVCKAGQMTCNAEGTSFGPCFDEVTPKAVDDCANKLDTSCDDKLTCACAKDETTPCYDGMPATTENVGICHGGMRACNENGTGFGECTGQVKPAAMDDCTTQADENCDGSVNEMASGCVCDPAVQMPSDCPTGKLGVCAAGTHMCSADGKSYSACTQTLMPSFEDCFTTDDEDCDGSAVACTGTSLFVGTAWTTSGDESVFGIAADADGSVLIGGASNTSAGSNYSISSGAAEIIKLDKTGVQLWKKTYSASGSGSYSVIRGVTVDGMGNVILIGEYQGTINSNAVSLTSTPGNNSDAFVIKLGADGSPKWGKSYGNGGDQFGAGISAAANGDVFLIGTMSLTMNFGATLLTSNGGTDLFVARLDGGTGDPKWAKNFGSSNTQYGWDVAATTDGHVVVTGQTQGGIDFGGGNIGSNLDKDIFLAKLDGNNGGQMWANVFGDSSDQVGYGVAVDSKGNIALTGYVNGKVDFGGGPLDTGSVIAGDLFVASFASNGAHRWSKSFGDTGGQVGRDVAVDAAGNVVVTGYYNGSFKFDSATTLTNSGVGGVLDVFVVKLRGSDGSFGWARSFGDAANDQVGRSIVADPSANVILGGTFKGAIDFGPPTNALMSPSNSFDSFYAKLAP